MNTLFSIGFVSLEIFSVILLADFVAGFIHWLEDAYAKPGMPFISKIAEENQLHHTKPRAFLANNWWQSSWDIALVSATIVATATYFDACSWPLVLFAVLVANANQIHKWAHKNRHENPKIVTWLQDLYILQNARHHGKHHTGEKNTHYCVITVFLNPILDNVGFWRGLEWIISALATITHQRRIGAK